MEREEWLSHYHRRVGLLGCMEKKKAYMPNGGEKEATKEVYRGV